MASPPSSSLVAFGDETVRATRDGSREYALVAAVVEERACAALREDLRSLLLRRQHRLHWRDESSARRAHLAAAVTLIPANHLFVVVGAVGARRQERARRRLLGRLVWELDQRQVSRLTMESRHVERDRHDEEAIGAFRNHGLLSRNLTVGFDQPRDEPMLWLADIVAGAVGDHRNLPEATDYTIINQVQVITLDPD